MNLNRKPRSLSRWPSKPSRISITFPSHEKLCFYPSSGAELLWTVMQLDCDLFVFSDKDRSYADWEILEKDFATHQQPLELLKLSTDLVSFRSGEKTGILIWHDNNLVLDSLKKHGLKVHHFVGICDGCCEGGNYECVHERPFVRRLMQVAAKDMYYTTDHSRPLQNFSGRGMWRGVKFMEHVKLSDFPEPWEYQRKNPCWPEIEKNECPDASFELLGVLVKPPEEPRSLSVLLKGAMKEPAQLDALRPFRKIAYRDILAEYRVIRQDVDHSQEDAFQLKAYSERNKPSEAPLLDNSGIHLLKASTLSGSSNADQKITNFKKVKRKIDMTETMPIVHIHNHALQGMLISCIETFPTSYIPKEREIRKRKNKDDKHDGETIGLLFGQRILRDNDIMVYNVTLAVTMQSREKHSNNSVSWSDVRFERIKQITESFPDLEFLGCFHSHPYAMENFSRFATEPSDEDELSAAMSALDHGTDVIEVILGLTAMTNFSYRDAKRSAHSIDSYCGKFKYRLSAYITSGIFDENGDYDESLGFDSDTEDDIVDYAALDNADYALAPVNKLICPLAASGGDIFI